MTKQRYTAEVLEASELRATEIRNVSDWNIDDGHLILCAPRIDGDIPIPGSAYVFAPGQWRWVTIIEELPTNG